MSLGRCKRDDPGKCIISVCNDQGVLTLHKNESCLPRLSLFHECFLQCLA
ncbi:unnamed protein product [Periconia digitata]|uniref:Uncharacterized protein n=1 Tax=Periconia digitata TaxID=1303443 RepID=A0A9W4U2G9_9PLEO|nr:unnamed protein product [Periconia digitata]